MRFIVLPLAAAISLTSCAYDGVIVQKRSRPHPLYHSIGVDGMYSFALRDSTGSVHSQMVTPEVFEGYAEGQYFNDLQSPPLAGGESKATHRSGTVVPSGREMPPEPVPFPTPTRVSQVPPPIETTQSFRASELERSSRSMTATMRMEVPKEAATQSDGVNTAKISSSAPEHRTIATVSKTTSAAKKKSTSTKRSSKSKAKPAAEKTAKPWRETAPVVQGVNSAPANPTTASADAPPPQ